jgi:hypothetical protein
MISDRLFEAVPLTVHPEYCHTMGYDTQTGQNIIVIAGPWPRGVEPTADEAEELRKNGYVPLASGGASYATRSDHNRSADRSRAEFDHAGSSHDAHMTRAGALDKSTLDSDNEVDDADATMSQQPSEQWTGPGKGKGVDRGHLSSDDTHAGSARNLEQGESSLPGSSGGEVTSGGSRGTSLKASLERRMHGWGTGTLLSTFRKGKARDDVKDTEASSASQGRH